MYQQEGGHETVARPTLLAAVVSDSRPFWGRIKTARRGFFLRQDGAAASPQFADARPGNSPAPEVQGMADESEE